MKFTENKYQEHEAGGIEIDLGHYLKVIRKRKLLIFSSIVLFLFFGGYYATVATPIYQASAKIQADPIQPNATSQDTYIMNSMIYLFYETQYEIIQSRKIAETVVDKLMLVEKYKQLAQEEKLEISQEGSSNVAEKIKSFIKDLRGVDDTVIDSPPTDLQIKTMLAQGIQSMIVVEGGTQSQIINISYEHEDPALAAEIVNAISDSYIEFGLESRLSEIKDTAAWLTEQLEDLRIALKLSEDKLRDFRIAQNLMDTEQQQRISNTQLQTLNLELVKAQTQLSEARELYNQVIQLEKSNGSYRSLAPVLQSNTIRDLVREESISSRKVEELTERYGERHPKLISARSELSSAKANLEQEASKIVESIKKQYRSAAAQEENVKKLIAQTRDELQSFQGDSFELTRLEREVENNRRIYESFLGKLMEADVTGDYDGSNIRIIDRATVPEYPIKPRIALILVASLFLGSIVGLSIAFVREFMAGVFRTPDQLETELMLPSLGITPLVKTSNKTAAPERQYIEDQRSTFAESINTIRTGLLFSDIDNPPKTILITSSNSSEGKTTLAINLAVSLSKMDKTLLLELDLRKPAVARDLQLEKNKGITDYTNFNDKEKFVKQLNGIDSLDIITCGLIPNNPLEIISSKRFNQFLEQMKSEYNYIVIDSPPILPVSDSCVLAKQTDATIIAVKAETTKVSTVKETISRLNKVNAKITGVVLTQASPEKMSYYGDHYYQEEYYGFKD